MDGTTLTHDQQISDENRYWIGKARESGIEVTFATGRHMSGLVVEQVQALGISAPLVTVNGGEVWAPGGELLSRHTLAVEDIRWMHGLARQYGTFFWAGTTTVGFFHDKSFPSSIDEYTWLKFGFQAEEEQVVHALWDELHAAGRFELSNSHPLNIEVNPLGVNKAAGLQVACDYLGIGPAQVVTMGDSLNDIAMLKWAGLGIAMGNAQEAVKQAADWVTATCDEHGVARAIERLLRENP